MKKLPIALFTAACMLLSACSNAPTSDPKSKAAATTETSSKDSISMAIANDIGDVNAHLYSGDMVVQGMLFEGLVENTPEGPKPCLAERWEISDDGKTYTFYLKKGVKFSDGEPMNAAAIKANMDAIQANKEFHNWLELSNKIVSCDIVDEYTVNLVLSNPYYPTLEELGLTRPYHMMSPATFINGATMDGVSDYVGTGAYKLEEYVEDQYAVFTANEKYHVGVPAIKKITMKVMPAGETPLLAMMNGEINFLFSTDTSGLVDADILRQLQKDNKFQVQTSHPCSTRYLLTNSMKERTIADKNIKQAVWYAINRQDMCSYVFSEFETPAQSIFARTVPYCDVDLPEREYSVDEAKSLIEKSAWVMDESTGYYTKEGKRLSLELVYNSSLAINKTTGEFIQANLKDAGIDVILVPSESTSVRQLRAAGNYDLYLDRSWGLPYDPQTTLTGLFGEIAYVSAAIDLECYDELHELVNGALVEMDEEVRQEYYNKILTIVHEESCFIPLSYSQAIIAAEKDLQGISFNQTQLEVPFKKFHY